MNWLPAVLTAVVSIGFIAAYVGRAIKLLKEVKELLEAVISAWADGKITKDEIDAILKEAKDIPKAVSDLIKKKKGE